MMVTKERRQPAKLPPKVAAENAVPSPPQPTNAVNWRSDLNNKEDPNKGPGNCSGGKQGSRYSVLEDLEGMSQQDEEMSVAKDVGQDNTTQGKVQVTVGMDKGAGAMEVSKSAKGKEKITNTNEVQLAASGPSILNSIKPIFFMGIHRPITSKCTPQSKDPK